MPARGIFLKNRSQGNLLSTQDTGRGSYQASPADSPLNSPGFPPTSAVSPLAREEDDQDYSFSNSAYRADDPRLYQPTGVSRSRSQRSSVSAQQVRNPTIHLVGPPHTRQGDFVEDNPDAYYRNPAPPQPRKEEQKQKRRFFGLGGHTSSSKETVTSPPNATRLGRSVSVRKNDPPNVQNIRGPYEQQRWPPDPHSVAYRPSIDQEEEGNGYRGSQDSAQRLAGNPPGPPIPEKDALRYGPQLTSPAYPDSRPYVVGPNINTNTAYHQQDRQPTSEPDTTWENPSRPLQQSGHHRQPTEQYSATSYQPSSATSNHPPQHNQASPSSTTSIASHPLRGPPDTLQQWRTDLHSNSRPASRTSSYNGPPSPLRPPSSQGDINQEKNSGPPNPNLRSDMAPPGPPQGKMLGEHVQQGQPGGISREQSGYQPYHQTGQGQGQQGGQPHYGQLNVNPQGQAYRGAPQPSPAPNQANPSEQQGRSTPPPSRSRDDLSGLDVAQLLARHDELQDKYRKVKKYYFDKDAQVQSLQNTLAHTRLSQSRTSFDDNEYASRLSRLDGAINNLAYNIRRDWATIPLWLAPYVNKDALTSPGKETMAVARAFVSRWLMDEILDKYFLPGLEPTFSMQLKIIERNLRRFAAPAQSEEEKEMLVAKISNWRLATLDGLHDTLSNAQSMEYRTQLTSMLVEKLTASLGMLLKDPPPAGLDGYVVSIVELTVSIAANLPLESRDVSITYVLPGTPINENIMRVEAPGAIPALTNPGEGIPEEGGAKADDTASMTTTNTEAGKESDDTEDSRRPSMASSAQHQQQQHEGGKQLPGQQQQQQTQAQQQSQLQQQQQQKKKGMFGGLMAGNNSSGKLTKGPPGQLQPQQQQPQQQQGGQGGGGGQPQQQSQQAQQQLQQQQAPPPQPKEEKVRFATFMACEVRGRSVLIKAPCHVL